MPKPTTIKWNTPGKLLELDSDFKVVASPDPVKDGSVEVTETGNSFYLPGFENSPIAGIPIDANLAVYLIKRLNDNLALLKEGSESINPNWLIDLVLGSRVITMDKNAVEKTLSQPGCEGLRFYLCSKPNVSDDPTAPVDILSLVTVGVDKDGKDLGYDFDEVIAKDIEENAVYKLPTQSMLSEFSHPPPPENITKNSAESTYIIGGYGWSGGY